MANLGALAGGMAAGIESGQRMRLQRERDTRDAERHQFTMGELQRTAETRDRQEAAWEELNAAIARRMQKQVPTQMQAPQQLATTSTGEPVDQGNGVQTMALQDQGAGIPTRALPEAPVQPASPEGGLTRAPTPAAAPAQAAGQGDDPGKKIGFSLYQNPNLLRDPDFLNEAAGIFMKARMPEGVKWLERSFKAQQENGIDAMKAFIAGDAQRGLEAFNSSGRDRITNAQPIVDGEHKGKWALTFQGAPQPVMIDPGAVLRSFLDPKAYFDSLAKDQDGRRRDAESGALVAERGAKTRALDAQAAAIQANAASLGEYRQRMGGAAETRAGRAGAPSAAMSTTRSAQVSREVERALTTSDGDGKGVLDRERAPFYKSIAAQLARQDPELTASEAADIAMSVPHITPKMAAEQAAEELRDLRKDVGVGDKAAGIFSGGGFKQAHGQTEEEWTKDRIKEIVRNAEAEADARLAELGVTRRRGDGSPAKPKVTQEAIAALRANPGRADDFRAMFGVDPAQYLTQSGARQTGATAASPPASEGAGLTRRSATAAPAQPLGEGLTRRGEQVFRREGANEVLDKKSTIDADPRVSFLRSDIAKAIEAKDMAKVGVLTKALNEYVSNKYGGWQ